MEISKKNWLLLGIFSFKNHQSTRDDTDINETESDANIIYINKQEDIKHSYLNLSCDDIRCENQKVTRTSAPNSTNVLKIANKLTPFQSSMLKFY